MIPIGDTAPRYARPLIVPLLIVANIAVFALRFGLDDQAELLWIARLAVTPADFFDKWHAVAADSKSFTAAPLDFALVAVTPLVTYQFLHAGPMHLAGNMLFLWVFGDNVEGRFGRLRFAVFYVACGIVAALVHCFMMPLVRVPVVGASGAVAGVLGAYFLMFPRARVLLILPLFVLWTLVELPAWFALGVWFALQIPQVQGVLGRLDVAGVAYWAHVGGFLAGIVLLPLCLLGNARQPRGRRVTS